MLSFNTNALWELSFCIWSFHLIINVIFYILRLKEDFALFLQLTQKAKGQLVSADFREQDRNGMANDMGSFKMHCLLSSHSVTNDRIIHGEGDKQVTFVYLWLKQRWKQDWIKFTELF